MLCACSKELYLLHMFVKNFELDIIKRRWFLGLCPLVNIIIRPPPSKFLYPPLPPPPPPPAFHAESGNTLNHVCIQLVSNYGFAWLYVTNAYGHFHCENSDYQQKPDRAHFPAHIVHVHAHVMPRTCMCLHVWEAQVAAACFHCHVYSSQIN